MIWPSDVATLIQYKYFRPQLYRRGVESRDVQRCWELLKHTSRSFAAVIEELHPELRNPMMIFYLVLRALDTIEDDTSLDPSTKIPLLAEFRQVALTSKTWTFHGSSPTEKDKVVLEEFDVILRVYHDLPNAYQDVIADITAKMGQGMAKYSGVDSPINRLGLPTIADYDLYCHYVAGIVGEGISRMARIAEFAGPEVTANPQLYESMGQFLQKTNIIRDYREDLDDGRSFWPQEVWKRYVGDLGDFVTDPVKGQECVSQLLLLSLQLVPDCLAYLSNVTEPSLFRFCAIPQVMSIATLELVYRNPSVFKQNVKISKPLACRLILAATDMAPVYGIFRDFVTRIHSRNTVKDPNFFAIEQQCAKILQYIDSHDQNGLAAHSRKELYKPPPFKFLFWSLSADELEGAKIMAVAGLLGLGMMVLMMGLSVVLGAEYPNPWKVAKKYWEVNFS